MNLKKSLYYRAKALVGKHDRARIARENQFAAPREIPLSMLETMETVSNYVPGKATLLDIGAHKGWFAKAASLFCDLERTVCFEPNERLHERIRTATTGLDVTIEHLALCGHTGEIDYFLHQDDSMNSTVPTDNQLLRDEFPWDNPEHLRETRVPALTLDDYVSRSTRPDEVFFVKIDTQGNELNILQHGKGALERTAVIVAEFMFVNPYRSSYGFVDFVTFMEEHGFCCQGALTIQKRPSKKVSAVDFLFVRGNRT